MRVLAILQARMSSSRLPNKVLLPLFGEPMLARQIERLRRATSIDHLIVATSAAATDDPIAEQCEKLGAVCYRGSLDDVLDRFEQAARPHAPKHVLRLTADCPLTDPNLIDQLVARHIESRADYTTNANPPSFPDGLDAEIMRYAVLHIAWREAQRKSEREHVTLYIASNPDRFIIETLRSETDLSALRWTVDEKDDLALVERIYAALYPRNPAFTTQDILHLLEDQPELRTLNTSHRRNEGLEKSLAQEKS
ncbi:glycosyltransferase family protein [Uliginosibacterium sp. H3]|uniref:Glycosyltransferase family protein n=1 Tax=Uliginosibacterium silvisoli TaxID=3114758 RepID=A0ABU6K932_9RHOO|nr:glycosyltransferase family protein [Uliginosibacterium sp. H3]